MARPACPGRGPSTTMLFRITIQRPGGVLRRRCGRLRRGRRCGKTVCFRASGPPLSPFFLFMRRHRRRLQCKNPNLTMVQAAKKLGRMWQQLPEADKNLYKRLSRCLKYRRSARACRVRRACSTRRVRRARRVCRSRRARRSRSRCRGPRKAMKDLMISFTTKAASLRNFLMSCL